MVFSSISFLFFFLTLLFLSYFLVPKKYRNNVLLIFSLIFYYIGEKWYVFLLLLSCLINYIIGLLIEQKRKKLYLIIGLVFNIGLLFYFKYTNLSFCIFKISISLHNISLLDIIKKNSYQEGYYASFHSYIILCDSVSYFQYSDSHRRMDYRKI